MVTYEFTYVISGTGNTEEEALDDALAAFVTAPGDPSSSELIETTEET